MEDTLHIPTKKELYDYHQDAWLALDVDLRLKCIAIILAHFKGESGEEDKEDWRKVITTDPLGWSTVYHFRQGMYFRNLLRKGGVTDDVVGRNLDDIWVPAFEAAMFFLQILEPPKPSMFDGLRKFGRAIVGPVTLRKDLQSRP